MLEAKKMKRRVVILIFQGTWPCSVSPHIAPGSEHCTMGFILDPEQKSLGPSFGSATWLPGYGWRPSLGQCPLITYLPNGGNNTCHFPLLLGVVVSVNEQMGRRSFALKRGAYHGCDCLCSHQISTVLWYPTNWVYCLARAAITKWPELGGLGSGNALPPGSGG